MHTGHYVTPLQLNCMLLQVLRPPTTFLVKQYFPHCIWRRKLANELCCEWNGYSLGPCSRITSSWAAIYQNTNIALLKSDTLVAVAKTSLQSWMTAKSKNYNFTLFGTINTDILTDSFLSQLVAIEDISPHPSFLTKTKTFNGSAEVFILLDSLWVEPFPF